MANGTWKIIGVVLAMLIIALTVSNISTFITLKKTKEALEAEKNNYGKNNAVKEGARKAITERSEVRDSLLQAMNEVKVKYLEKEQELAQIKADHKKLYDAINNIDNVADHMRMGDSLIAEWESRFGSR